jgi:hypothetical protein
MPRTIPTGRIVSALRSEEFEIIEGVRKRLRARGGNMEDDEVDYLVQRAICPEAIFRIKAMPEGLGAPIRGDRVADVDSDIAQKIAFLFAKYPLEASFVWSTAQQLVSEMHEKGGYASARRAMLKVGLVARFVYSRNHIEGAEVVDYLDTRNGPRAKHGNDVRTAGARIRAFAERWGRKFTSWWTT